MSAPSSSIAKTIAAPEGDNATHWVIRRISVSTKNSTIVVDMSGFLNSTAFGAGDTELDQRTFELSGSDYTSIIGSASGVITALYAWIVANAAEFSGGTIG